MAPIRNQSFKTTRFKCPFLGQSPPAPSPNPAQQDLHSKRAGSLGVLSKSVLFSTAWSVPRLSVALTDMLWGQPLRLCSPHPCLHLPLGVFVILISVYLPASPLCPLRRPALPAVLCSSYLA